MQVERKLTIGGMNGVRKGFKGIKEKTFVARVLGIVNSATVEDGQLGAYHKFVGEFQGTNQNGELFTAPVCMLPEPASGMLYTAVQSAEGGSVKFGFDFHVVPDESVAIGYKYATTPLLETKPSNPLAEMLASIPALPQLAAPSQPALTGTEPATEKPAENAAEKSAEKAAPKATNRK